MTILVIEPGKRPAVQNSSGSLESMQKLVGGTIQAIYPFEEPVALVCNDEGKLQNLSPNRCLQHPDTKRIYDIVYGTFFLCAAPPDSDCFEGLTPEQIQYYTNYFEAPELFLPTENGLLILKQSGGNHRG